MEKLTIGIKLPVIETNLSVVKTQVDDFLKNYNFVVTEDGIKFAREKSTELNKLAETLDRLRIDKVREISAPIAAFDKDAKEIHGMITNARKSILQQLQIYEANEKAKVGLLLKKELKNLWALHGVQSEFQKATCEDLAIASNATPSGKLTSKADKVLMARVLADVQTQNTITARLLSLESESLRAGLSAPLGRHNVAHFLFATNYEEQLKTLIDSELRRQVATEARIAAQLEARQQMQIQVIQAQAEKAQTETKKQAEAIVKNALSIANNQQSNQPANITDGDAEYTITVTIKMVAKDMNIEGLKKATLRKFAKTGFKNVDTVNVEKVAIGRPTNIAAKTTASMVADGSLF